MINYFEIFHLNPAFNIDIALLESKYHDLQRNFHPDLNNINDLEKSIHINSGYKILSDDFLRASHLLQLKNINIEDEDCAIKPDKSMLIDIIALQEKIFDPNFINNQQSIKITKKNINDEILKLLQEFEDLYNSSDFLLATQKIIKIKYLKKTLNDLKKITKI